MLCKVEKKNGTFATADIATAILGLFWQGKEMPIKVCRNILVLPFEEKVQMIILLLKPAQ